MAWTFVCELSDLDGQDWLSCRADEVELILFRLDSGRPVCFLDQCSHQDVRLSDFGRRSGDRLLCFAHGAIFSLQDGAPLRAPACESLQQFPCRLQGRRVEVELGGEDEPQ